MLILGLMSLFTLGALFFALQFIPMWNKLFDKIWQDPTEKERIAVRRRLEELHIDGHVPEEMAVLMAAKEYSKTERDILEAAQLLSAADIGKMAMGKTSLMGVVLNGIQRALKRGVKFSR